MAAAERSTADLIASIAGCDMLAGWHVLVAYRVDEINRILAARHAEIDKNASISEVKQFSHTYEGKDKAIICAASFTNVNCVLIVV